jgi:hypothetical protein
VEPAKSVEPSQATAAGYAEVRLLGAASLLASSGSGGGDEHDVNLSTGFVAEAVGMIFSLRRSSNEEALGPPAHPLS